MKHYQEDFKRKVVKEYEKGIDSNKLSKKYGMAANMVLMWVREYRGTVRTFRKIYDEFTDMPISRGTKWYLRKKKKKEEV